LNKLIKIQALSSLTEAAGLLVWWFSMPLFLPVAEASENFQELILDPSWIPVNLEGAPVFGNGVIFPARTVGLLLFSAGTIWLALQFTKSRP